MKINNIPDEINFILKNKNEKLFFTKRITNETKSISLDKLFQKKILPILINGFSPKDEEEQMLLDKIEEAKKTNKMRIEISCLDSIRIEVYVKRDAHCSSCLGTVHLSYDRIYELINKEDIFTFYFINTINFSSFSLVLELYKVSYDNDILTIDKVESKSIMSKKGIGLELSSSLPDFIEFLEKDDIGLFEKYGLEQVKDLIFNNHSYEQGFFDIYENIENILSNCIDAYENYRNINKKFSILYYYGFTDYYYFMEAMIKSKQIDNIEKLNPYYTGKDIPKVSDIKTISNSNLKLIETIESRLESSLIELAADMENNSKIGIDGLNIILNTLSLMNNAENLSLNIFTWFRLNETLSQIQTIINQFDVTPKNLMDKMIREMFYNNIRARDFFQYVYDYIHMCKALNVNIDKKLPKDVIRRHDLLILQLRDLEQKHLEKSFDLANNQNIELLQFAPKGTKYMIYCPKSLSDLIEKGFEANHCVGCYGSRVIDGSSKIFFVEEQNANGVYFVTFELNKDNQLIQAKGFSNSTPNKEVMNFIKEFVKNINE